MKMEELTECFANAWRQQHEMSWQLCAWLDADDSAFTDLGLNCVWPQFAI